MQHVGCGDGWLYSFGRVCVYIRNGGKEKKGKRSNRNRNRRIERLSKAICGGKQFCEARKNFLPFFFFSIFLPFFLLFLPLSRLGGGRALLVKHYIMCATTCFHSKYILPIVIYQCWKSLLEKMEQQFYNAYYICVQLCSCCSAVFLYSILLCPASQLHKSDTDAILCRIQLALKETVYRTDAFLLSVLHGTAAAANFRLSVRHLCRSVYRKPIL